MAGDQKPGQYWRDVIKGAWSNTLRRVGWDPTKAVLASAAFVGSWVLGGFFLSATSGFLIGILLLAPFIFLWGVVQTQAEMNINLRNQERKSVAAVVAAPEPDYLATPKPDYAKWRHVQEMDLKTAAQLWTGERPGMGMGGNVKETFAMLQAAIQNGELAFIADSSPDPSARDTVRQLQRKNPHPATKVTRPALKTFADKYGNDPEFLRELSTEQQGDAG